jgi:hypothetical protein
MPEGYRKHMGVTPQIMSRAVVDPMLDHLARIGHQNETWDSYLLRLLLDNLYSTDPTQRGIVPWTVCSLVPLAPYASSAICTCCDHVPIAVYLRVLAAFCGTTPLLCSVLRRATRDTCCHVKCHCISRGSLGLRNLPSH